MAAMRVFAALFVTLLQLPYTSADASGVRRAAPAAPQSIDTKLADTVRALDTNGNGKVDKSELAVFAKSQGLSTDEVMSDFTELDANHDGALDASEIGPLFASNEAETKTEVANKAAAISQAADTKTEAPRTPAATPPAAEVPTEPAKAVSAAAAPKLEFRKPLPVVVDEAPVTPVSQVATGVQDQQANADSMGLDLAGLDRDAQNQAGGVIASRLAQRAQVLLARSAVDEKKAEAFDIDVRTLRGNATALAKSANDEARAAARAATQAVSKEAQVKLQALQADEHKAAAAADKHREEAQKAMRRVRKAQASLRSS